MTDNGDTWKIEDGWTTEFEWFLIDEGRIWYSFCTKDDAVEFSQEHFFGTKLLLSAEQVLDVLMTSADDYRAWRCKSPVHVVREPTSDTAPYTTR